MHWVAFPRLMIAVGALASLSGCITVNIYFPAPEVRRAAEEIVEETWGGSADAQPTAAARPEGGQSSWWDRLGPKAAHAQEADINVSTAAIRALKDSMKKRAEDLKPFLNAGQVGIDADGLLAVRSLEGVSLRDQASIRRLIEAENRDRKSLYREIAKANKFGEDRVPDIQRIFAETWIAKAEKGWWVRMSGGDWQKR